MLCLVVFARLVKVAGKAYVCMAGTLETHPHDIAEADRVEVLEVRPTARPCFDSNLAASRIALRIVLSSRMLVQTLATS